MAKRKVQKEKQRSTKHTHKTKDLVTRTPLKTGGDLRYSEWVSSYCSTSGFVVLSGVSDKTMQICPELTFSDKFKILLREAVSYNTFSEKIFLPISK